MNNPFGVKNYDGFPLNALPPLLRNTLLEVEQKIQSPIGLIASSMLSSMAIACQGAFNIRTPIGSALVPPAGAAASWRSIWPSSALLVNVVRPAVKPGVL